MKRILLFIIFISFFCVSKNSFAQTDHPAVYKELILGIPSVDPRNYEDIKNHILTMGGVKLIGYCSQHKCFLLKYDSNKIQNPDAIVKSIEEYKSEYKVDVKKDATLAQLIGECVTLSADEENDTENGTHTE